MAQPSKSGKGGGSSAPTTSPTASIDVPMKWCALANIVPGSYSLAGGLVITFPQPASVLQRLDADTTDNVVIVPMPAELVDGISEEQPWACKPVKGRLPQLKLYPAGEGNNTEQWVDYLAAHQPRSARVTEEEWRNRPLTLSSKKES